MATTEQTHTSAPLPADDPRLVAWNAYKETPEFANTLSWCGRDGGQHATGSLWAAFIAGYSAKTAEQSNG